VVDEALGRIEGKLVFVVGDVVATASVEEAEGDLVCAVVAAALGARVAGNEEGLDENKEAVGADGACVVIAKAVGIGVGFEDVGEEGMDEEEEEVGVDAVGVPARAVGKGDGLDVVKEEGWGLEEIGVDGCVLVRSVGSGDGFDDVGEEGLDEEEEAVVDADGAGVLVMAAGAAVLGEEDLLTPEGVGEEEAVVIGEVGGAGDVGFGVGKNVGIVGCIVAEGGNLLG